MTTATLRDGGRVEIRPIQPSDRDRLAAGHERLSPQSRYRRFFGPKPVLSARDLDYLTRVDHHDHEALLATDPETGDGIGVARFVRTGPDSAEPAIVVADDWHGRGVGTLLLEALARRAREEGIVRFDAPVLASNLGAIRIFERLGATRVEPRGNEVALHIDLHPAPAPPAPSRAHSLLRDAARGLLEPARTLLETLWPRRRGAPDDARRNLIVVGTDGSEHSGAAVDAAAALAVASGATVHVVGVHRFLLPEQGDVAAAVHDAAHALRGRGVPVQEHLRRGDPALVLTDVAADEQARLVVVGSGERGKTARRLLGSVADFVAERSPCDVLVVRPRHTAEGDSEPARRRRRG